MNAFIHMNTCAVNADGVWPIPADEISARRDLRQTQIFSIDPPTARDLDDALHYIDLPDGGCEVGVHIADVSYFMKAGTELDKIASRRATSTYLVDRCYPMLPRLLCENLCRCKTCTCMRLCRCACMSSHVCVCVCVSVCTHAYMFAPTYAHTHTHIHFYARI